MSGWGPIVSSGKNSGSAEVVVIGGGQIPDTSAIDSTGSEYQEALSVGTGIETNILVYVVPASPDFHLVRFEFGGGNIATYSLYVDNVRKAQCITWWNTGMNGFWDFKSAIAGGLIIPGGSQIRVTCLHNRPYVADFYTRMEYVLIS